MQSSGLPGQLGLGQRVMWMPADGGGMSFQPLLDRQDWLQTLATGLPSTPDKAVKRRKVDWLEKNLRHLEGVTLPADRPRRMIFTAFTRFGIWAKAKVFPADYFPAFTRRMAEHGVDCHFVWDETGLERLAGGQETAIVHLVNEDRARPYNARIRMVERQAGLVFCTHQIADIIGNKLKTNQFLTARGIPMPRLVEPDNHLRSVVFSNSVTGSGKRVIVGRKAARDATRYNTEFIDTRVAFEGQQYHTMFRIQAVGRKVLHAYVRARDVRERAASVHNKDTPCDAGLVEYLYDRQIRARWDEITDLASRLGEALGPGSYAHDMVICNRTKQIYLVESGFKFNDSPYAGYLESISDQTPCNAIFYSGDYPVRSADLFVEEWDWYLGNSRADPLGATF